MGEILSNSLQQVFDGGSFLEEFVLGDVESSLGFLAHGKTLDNLVFSVFAGDGVTEDKTLFDTVATIGGNTHGGPLSVGSGAPVSDVINGGITSRGSAGELSGLQDSSTSLLDDGDEVLINPVVVNELHGGLSINSAVVEIGVHGG